MSASLLNTVERTDTDTATFGTGCFWCTEAVFEQLNGVLSVTSGRIRRWRAKASRVVSDPYSVSGGRGAAGSPLT